MIACCSAGRAAELRIAAGIIKNARIHPTMEISVGFGEGIPSEQAAAIAQEDLQRFAIVPFILRQNGKARFCDGSCGETADDQEEGE